MADIMDFIHYGNLISIELCVSRESVKYPRDLYVSIFTHYVYSGWANMTMYDKENSNK